MHEHNNRLFFKMLIAAVFAAILFSMPICKAEARSLEDFEQEILSYQENPWERAEALEKEIDRCRGSEEGIARQNGVAVSRILRYELMLEEQVNLYRSIFFMQKHGNQENSFLLSSERIAEIVNEKPPYSFLFYLSFIEDIQNASREVAFQEERIASAKEALSNASKAKTENERAYRLRSAKVGESQENMLTRNWEFTETKVKLEQSIVTHTFYSTSQELGEAGLEIAKEKQKILESMLPKVHENLKVSRDDFQYLDAAVFSRLKRLHNEIKLLSARHADLLDVIKEDPLPAPFTKYARQAELSLVETEILLLLDMVEYWSSMRLTWTTTADLLEGDLSINEEKKMVETTSTLISDAESTMTYCGKEIQRIRECQQEVQRRFSNEFVDTPQHIAESQMLFMQSLEAQKKRYLAYIVDLGGMKSQYNQLMAEINRILEQQSPEKHLQYLWYEKVYSIVNFELWHFGDYPVTLYGLLKAILIMSIGLVLTHYTAGFFRRRILKKDSMSEHSALLVEKMFYYIGFIFSALIALWSLRIPLTAFAFLGGAMAIALGLGTQKIMGDLFSGLLLIFQKKLRIGDEVIIGGERGIVREITIQNTILRCDMSKDLIIPNSKVHESAVTNLTREDSKIMASLFVSIACDSDLDEAEKIISDILTKEYYVLKEPKFMIRFNEFEEHAIKIKIMFFVDLKQIYDSDAASRVRHKIREAFAAAGIKRPLPRAEIQMKEKEEEI